MNSSPLEVSTEIDFRTIPKINEEVLYLEQPNGDFIVFKTNSINSQFKIDGYAAIIWKHIDGEKSLDDLLNISVSLTKQEPDYLKNQMASFFADLQKIGLIEYEH